MHMEHRWELGYCRSRDRMNCPCDERPHNSILRPTALASKNLSPAEDTATMGSTRDTTRTREISTLLLCHRGRYSHRSQVTCSNLQEKCSNSNTETPIHTIKNSPTQNQDTIQAWTRPIHSRLAVRTKLQREQGQRNICHEDKCSVSNTEGR